MTNVNQYAKKLSLRSQISKQKTNKINKMMISKKLTTKTSHHPKIDLKS